MTRNKSVLMCIIFSDVSRNLLTTEIQELSLLFAGGISYCVRLLVAAIGQRVIETVDVPCRVYGWSKLSRAALAANCVALFNSSSVVCTVCPTGRVGIVLYEINPFQRPCDGDSTRWDTFQSHRAVSEIKSRSRSSTRLDRFRMIYTYAQPHSVSTRYNSRRNCCFVLATVAAIVAMTCDKHCVVLY